jgi:hypothetical protein
MTVTGTETPSSVKTRVMPLFLPTRPIIIVCTRFHLYLCSIWRQPLFMRHALPLCGAACHPGCSVRHIHAGSGDAKTAYLPAIRGW